MNIHTDFLPRVKVEDPGRNDKSLSYTGQADFTKAEPDIRTMNPRLPNMRPRSLASKNNSYT